MKTIAQQLNIKTFPFYIKDSDGNEIYYERADGFWVKNEYDADGKKIYFEDSAGFWSKREYDADGKQIYCEDSTGYWAKREYADGKQIYYEDSNGYIMDNRPKTDVQKAIDLLTAKGLLVDGKILKN